MFEKKALLSSVYLFFLLFVVGIVLVIPFPYNILPDISHYISPYILHILGFIFDKKALTFASDSEGLLLWGILYAFLCILVAFSAFFWRKLWAFLAGTKAYFYSFCAYYLAMMLFRYGWDKLFKHQFYQPEPNILYTPFGDLEIDMLYWSTMGKSYTFSLFGGIMELVPAFLLLFRPTRLLGAVWAFAVLWQIVVINISFDITVKFLSSFLMLISLILISPYFSAFYRFFILKEKIQLAAYPIIKLPLTWYFFLKYSLIAVIFIETLFPFLQTNNWNDDNAARPPYHGAYQVQQFWQNGDSIFCQNEHKWKRVFFHRQGYFIWQNEKDKMQDFEYQLIGSKIVLFDEKHKPIGQFYISPQKNKNFILQGRLQKDSIRLLLEKL